MCYAVPTASAVITSVMWSRTKDIKIWWLNLMFWGGALFGFVDHLYHGELFLISENLMSDLFLGAIITISILVGWRIALACNKGHRVLASG